MPDLLYETPDNPIPEGAAAEMLTTADGKRLRCARFPASGRPLKGTVIIIPGRNECIEKYYETARDLSERGFGSVTFDLRGQGGSDRLIRDPHRGYVYDFDDYVSDLEPFFEQIVLPDCRGPYFVLAHSTGSLIAMRAAPLMTNRVQRMVLSAPLLGFAGTPLAKARRYASFYSAIGLGKRYLGGTKGPYEPSPFAGNTLTSDPVRYARTTAIYERHPELALGGPTAAWIRAVCLAIERVEDPDFVAAFNVPTLIVAAGSDQVVDNAATDAFAARLRVGSLITIDGARHEILQEADFFRQQFLAAFDAFIPGTQPAVAGAASLSY